MRKLLKKYKKRSTFIDLDEDDIKDVTPITNDQVIEDFDEVQLEKMIQNFLKQKETKKAQGR